VRQLSRFSKISFRGYDYWHLCLQNFRTNAGKWQHNWKLLVEMTLMAWLNEKTALLVLTVPGVAVRNRFDVTYDSYCDGFEFHGWQCDVFCYILRSGLEHYN